MFLSTIVRFVVVATVTIVVFSILFLSSRSTTTTVVVVDGFVVSDYSRLRFKQRLRSKNDKFYFIHLQKQKQQQKQSTVKQQAGVYSSSSSSTTKMNPVQYQTVLLQSSSSPSFSWIGRSNHYPYHTTRNVWERIRGGGSLSLSSSSITTYSSNNPIHVTTTTTNTTTITDQEDSHYSNHQQVDNEQQHKQLQTIQKEQQEQKQLQKQQTQRGISLSLSVAYFTVMGAKCALPAVLALLVAPSPSGLTFPTLTTTISSSSSSSQPQYYIAQLLFLSTIAIASGKVLLGPIIDTLGGMNSLRIALSGLMCSLLLLSFCQSFIYFATIWIFIDFIFSSCWAACIHGIHQTYPPPPPDTTNLILKEDEGDQSRSPTSSSTTTITTGSSITTIWSQQIGYIAASARLGNAVAFTIFSLILSYYEPYMKQPWRPVFIVAGMIQVIPILLLTYYGQKKNNINNNTNNNKQINRTTTKRIPDDIKTSILPPSTPIKNKENQLHKLKQSILVLRNELLEIDFWLHFISRSVLMIYASFLLFVPTLLSTVYQTSNAMAARVGSYYAIGCLVAVTILSPIYSKLSSSQSSSPPPVLSPRTKNNENGNISSVVDPTKKKLIAITLMLLVGATGSSIAQLGHMMNLWTLSVPITSLSFFLWGLSFSIPFYIPPSLYALQKGGTASATIVDIFDIGGFTLLALFNKYVASITNKTLRSSWIGTFQITTLCSLISYIALSVTMIREMKSTRIQTHHKEKI